MIYIFIAPGTPSKKARTAASAVAGCSTTPVSGLKPLPRTPWDRVLKYDIRGRMQLRWDLWITEYFVRLGLPWSMLDHPAHKEFWAKENHKYHCKHSTTYSRAKLQLLFNSADFSRLFTRVHQIPNNIQIRYHQSFLRL